MSVSKEAELAQQSEFIEDLARKNQQFRAAGEEAMEAAFAAFDARQISEDALAEARRAKAAADEMANLVDEAISTTRKGIARDMRRLARRAA